VFSLTPLDADDASAGGVAGGGFGAVALQEHWDAAFAGARLTPGQVWRGRPGATRAGARAGKPAASAPPPHLRARLETPTPTLGGRRRCCC
jgi:hypothetical protein